MVSDQGQLFDGGAPKLLPHQGGPSLPEAKKARDAALAQVEANADDDWKKRAFAALIVIAKRQETLIANDLWEVVERPREPRALGPVMMRGHKYGIVEPTSTYRPVPSAKSHAAPVRIWRSLCYEGGS